MSRAPGWIVSGVLPLDKARPEVTHLDELNTSRLQVLNVPENVVCSQSDVLNATTTIIVDVLLNLTLLLALCGLIDRHLDNLVWRRHDHRLQRRVLGADILVVNGPEAVEAECLFVVFTHCVHFVPVLVTDAVVHSDKTDLWQKLVDRIKGCLLTVAWKEGASVRRPINQSMGGLAVGLDGSCPDGAEFVSERGWFVDRFSTGCYGGVEEVIYRVDLESDVWLVL